MVRCQQKVISSMVLRNRAPQFQDLPPSEDLVLHRPYKCNLVKNTAVDFGLQFCRLGNSRVQIKYTGFNNAGIAPKKIFRFMVVKLVNQVGVANGNTNAGISITSNNNKIGGWEHWMRNVISGMEVARILPNPISI